MKFIEELEFLKEQLSFKEKVEIPGGIDNVVIAGMGGSGIAAKIFQEFYSKKPVVIVDDYHIPDFVSDRTLFIASSYSGNTEEVISALSSAVSRNAHTVAISSGGKIAGMGDQHIRIPRSDLQPRSSTIYMLMPLFNGFGVISAKEIRNSYKILSELDESNGECLKYARKIAAASSIPVVYGSHPYKSIAYRWKTQFNENSKIISYSNSFPELNHNDLMPLAQTYKKESFCFFTFEPENPRVKKRLLITAELTKSKFEIIKAKGSTQIERMFYLLHYGDYLSYHLGVLRRVDNSDVSIIENLKKRLARV